MINLLLTIVLFRTIIIKIIGISLAWLIIGFFTTLFTSDPPKDFDGKDYDRFIFSIVIWPIALIIRIIKFIIGFLVSLYIGFKEELKHK